MPKLRLAIIGCKTMGTKHFNTLKEYLADKVEVVGILNSSVESSKAKSLELGVPFFEDIKDITKDKVDAAIIATPAGLHKHFAVDFLSKGIDCLVEKPFALNEEECLEIIKASEKSGAILMVGYLLIFDPLIAFLKKELSNTKITKFKSVRTTIANNRSPDVTIIQNLMSHDLSILHSLSGFSIKDISSIKAKGDKARGTHAYANVVIEFNDGLQAELTADMVQKNNIRSAFVEDSFGNIYEMDFMKGVLFKNKEEIFRGENPLKEQLIHFIDCCLQHKKSHLDGKSAMIIEDMAMKVDKIFRKSYIDSK